MIINPDYSEFRRQASGADLVPVWAEIPSDLETPVSAYLKVVGEKKGFLLESVEGGENISRYSFLGTRPDAVIRAEGENIEVSSGGRVSRETGPPLDFLRDYLRQKRVYDEPRLPRFSGGLVGFLGYDIVRHLEQLPDHRLESDGFPEIALFFAGELLVFDHVRQKIQVITHADTSKGVREAWRESVKRIRETVGRLEKTLPRHRREAFTVSKPFLPPLSAVVSREDFIRSVKKAKEYIRRGDIIQVVLSQRFYLDCDLAPGRLFNLYRMLRSLNPSPYLFYLNFGPEAIVGSSPEVMVRLEGRRASLRPIAGTRPRGGDESRDRWLEDDLKRDEKEKAEHIMLVDLGRNDLGRVCLPGSVKVDELMVVERYSHVMHLVSNVQGSLAPEKDAFHLFAACFPAGTVSGAPKVRAMELIEELERCRRGPYAGAVGYFDFAGNLDSAITIRTIFVREGRLFFQVGAGIVADSDPDREYEETMNKGRALVEALSSADIWKR